jgi:hypothetical protein
MSGAGLPRATSVALKILPLNRGNRPVAPGSRGHFRVTAARGHAVRHFQRIEHRLDTADRLHFSLERRRRAKLKFAPPVSRNLFAQHAGDLIPALLHRAADEVLEHEFERDRQSQLLQQRGKHAAGDQLAVHQDPIAIKDHQLKTAHAGNATGFGNCAPGRK